jgi:hypothetical protein
MLLHIIKGAKSYFNLRTVEGRLYPTFQDACQALGLLGDDRQWSYAITNASHWALPHQLRELFVTILNFCHVANPLNLFEEHMCVMGQDAFFHINRGTTHMDSSMTSSMDYIRSYALTEIDRLLKNYGHSLTHYHLPQPNIAAISMIRNSLLMDEQVYDMDMLSTEASEQLSKLNLNQRHMYDAILQSVHNDSGYTFFVYGFGGTGKTFLWNTLLNYVRSKGKIALAVASSGLTSLLLPGGRTPHSRFKIPLDIHEHSVCSIMKNTQLAQLVQETSLIIWDEAEH